MNCGWTWAPLTSVGLRSSVLHFCERSDSSSARIWMVETWTPWRQPQCKECSWSLFAHVIICWNIRRGAFISTSSIWRIPHCAAECARSCITSCVWCYPVFPHSSSSTSCENDLQTNCRFDALGFSLDNECVIYNPSNYTADHYVDELEIYVSTPSSWWVNLILVRVCRVFSPHRVITTWIWHSSILELLDNRLKYSSWAMTVTWCSVDFKYTLKTFL